MQEETQITINGLSGLFEDSATYMLTWLSADGRPQHRYFYELQDAEDHFDRLIELDRQPKIWLDLTSEETPTH
jgi:hypothetical protein